MEQRDYLQENFDPKSLKVPQLRNILNEYEVHYPSNAKKTELITLFNDNVYSNRSQLLKSFNDAIENANSDGFIDMAKENHHPVDPVVSDADVSVDKAKLTGKTSKKSKAAREEPTESDIEMMVSDGESEKTEKPKKKKSASKSKKKTTSANKVSRPTHSTSDLKEKLTTTTPEVSFKEEGKVDSPFSNENTFQKSPSSSRRSVTPQPRSPQSSKSPSQIDSSKHETPKGSRKRKKSESSEERVKKKPKEDKLEASKKQTPSKVTPKKQTPNKETLTKDTAKEDTFKTGHTPKDVKEVSIIDLSSPKADSKKSTPKRSLKLTPSNVSSRSNISTPRLNSIAGELDESPEAKPVFESLEDEAKHFDAQIKKSRGESAEAPTESEITDELAASLGIKIGGSWPNNMKTQNETLTPGPKLTPNPRRIDFELTKEKSIGEEEDGKQEDKQEEITAGDESDDDADTPVTNEESVEDASDKSSQSKVAFKSILPVFSYIMVWLVLSITGLGVYWYREQTFLIGYCGQEIDEPTFYNPENPVINKLSDVLDSFKPSCVKCPAHARCFDNLELGCFEDFIEFKPWYFDLLPFINPASKKCVPDTKKAEKLEAMIDISLDLLRTKNGLIHCGTGDDNQESGIGLQQLYEILLSMKAPYITVDEFNELWERSIVELEKEPEIITDTSDGAVSANSGNIQTGGFKDSKTPYKVLRSTALSNLSLKCQLQNTIVYSLYNNMEIILAVIMTMIIVIIGKLKYDKHLKERLKIDKIYTEVINRLKFQKTQLIPYIGSNQLRDLILTESNLKYKLKLWKEVSRKIENNANINFRVIEDKGEIFKVWEWVSEI